MSKLIRGLDLMADRYKYDLKFREADNWFQVDTWQDASYFGVWTNPIELKIATYCEGDTSLEVCDDDADYRDALTRCLEFYDSERQRAKVDCIYASRSRPEIAERLRALGFADRIH